MCSCTHTTAATHSHRLSPRQYRVWSDGVEFALRGTVARDSRLWAPIRSVAVLLVGTHRLAASFETFRLRTSALYGTCSSTVQSWNVSASNSVAPKVAADRDSFFSQTDAKVGKSALSYLGVGLRQTASLALASTPWPYYILRDGRVFVRRAYRRTTAGGCLSITTADRHSDPLLSADQFQCYLHGGWDRRQT